MGCGGGATISGTVKNCLGTVKPCLGTVKTFLIFKNRKIVMYYIYKDHKGADWFH